jgi:transposase InsO family protein
MAKDDKDLRRAKALARYMVISAYLAIEPPRGQRRAVLEQLAGKVWEDANGQPMQVQAETLRVWIRRYRQGGLDALEDKVRTSRGILALTDEQIELACRLKREVPERSLDRLIRIMEEMKLVEPGAVRRSTLHRALQREGLSARQCRVPDRDDLDRFEAIAPNDLWQSDLLKGPWLPDPQRPGKVRRACLYAFIDDHSRMLLHGRFSFKGDLPALELVFRRCLQKFGAPRRVYYDNGATYRARHMKQVVAEVGIHPIIYTRNYRPMGHGKIEALNQYIRDAFLAELKASNITTLDAVNEAFVAWSDYEYNRKVHSETGQEPCERWRAGIEQVRYADEEKLRLAFLWREDRTPDKAGVFSLFGTKYQVGPELARKRIEVRYDPEALDEIEVYFKGRFAERVRPFEVQPERRPRKPEPPPPPAQPGADWLEHLVNKRQREGFIEPTPRQLKDAAQKQRIEADAAVVALFFERLEPAAINEAAIRSYLERYGPFEPEPAGAVLDRMLESTPRDLHVEVYLDAIRKQLNGDTP